ncbi:TonB-dependent receptor [Roseiterribacter gracilis]|uniref:TonB-dependent receptor n=1 Tax=Roseiterribacter gracilis TaxID=2812848 RepID=A0A8S8X9K3_9PROT|nr:TonB-dependent receptor [Rhodospirillales bacterium TMPK1]
MRVQNKVAFGVLMATTALVLPGTAYAQIEEVTVTASRVGATDLQKTPIAISAYSGAQIERTFSYGLKDLIQLTPNIAVAQNSSFAQVYIRGIGSNNVFNGSDPSSAVQVDGIYMARPNSQFVNFYDVERVEVLRGPQGTLYGRNATGGVINVISRKPSTEKLDAKAQETIGNYGFTRTEGYVNVPVTDKVAASLSAYYVYGDPKRTNIIPTGNDIDNQNQGGARGQVLVKLTDNIESITRFDFDSAYTHPMGFAKPLFRYTPFTNTILGDYSKVALNQTNLGTVRDYGGSEELNWQLGNGMVLKSLTGARHNLTKSRTDTDSSETNTTVSNIYESQRQFSQEVNLSGKIGALDFVGGLYYFFEQNQSRNVIEARVPNTGTAINPSVHTNAYAAYTQGTYHVTDQLSGTVGARYTQEQKDFYNTSGTLNLASMQYINNGPIKTIAKGKYYSFTPKFGVEYSPTKDIMLFASVTKGFKSGGFNQTNTNPFGGFAPEKLWSYEAGVKTEWLNKRLRVNFTGFKYNYDNLQVQAFIRPGVTDITNASDAEVWGLELETIVEPVKGLLFTANLSKLQATYLTFPAAPGPGGITVNATGNYLNSAPPYMVNFAADYTYDLAGGDMLFAHADYLWTDKQYFVASNDPQQSQGAYGLLNASIGYESPDGKWRASLWGKNLTGKQYVNTTATVSAVVSGRPGDLRTFGARLSWKL